MQLGDIANQAAAGNGKPLDGVRVLALEQMQALPYATQLLTRLGADVVKIESISGGDSGRGSLPAMTDPAGRRVGATFLRNNLSKRSICIDLKSPEGRQLVLDLAPRFDVVAENFKAGTLDRLGLGWDDISAVAPRTIYLSVSGFGATGSPYDRWPAYAPIAEAMSGIYEFKRQGDEPPMVAPMGGLGDIGSGLFATIGVLAALRHRDATGRGQRVDVAMLDAMVAITDIVTNFWSMGLRNGELGPLIMHGFRAGDGWFIIQVGRENQFAKLVEVIGHPEWATDPRFAERQGWIDHLDTVLRPAIEGWLSLDRARDLVRLGGQDFGTLKSQASSRDFKPVPLGVRASMTIKNTLRTLDSRNVIARLDGRDPQLKSEYVIYSAHWDHLGIGPAVNGDTIYNGAKDNAVGVAGMLEVARAFTKLPTPPRRSILFLALTAEEQGLLGSQYYAVTPLHPLARTVANINIDGMNVNGRTRDLTLVGYGASELDDYARDAAGEQGRIIRADPEPEKGFYYRSDHFNFAKQGIPALDPDEGLDYIGKSREFGEQARAEWNERDYHQPSDVVRSSWDLTGALEDLKVFLAVGYRVAEADAMPEWKPGNEFKARRDEMLKGRK